VEGILTSIEPGLGIILGSVAATRPLFKLLFDKTRTYASSKSASRNNKRSLGSSDHAGSRSRRSQLNPDSGECIRLHSYQPNGKEFGTVMVVEGRSRLCRKCSDIEEQKLCYKCGAPTGLIESQEDLTRVQTPSSMNHAIYRDVTIQRVVEFLTKDWWSHVGLGVRLGELVGKSTFAWRLMVIPLNSAPFELLLFYAPYYYASILYIVFIGRLEALVHFVCELNSLSHFLVLLLTSFLLSSLMVLECSSDELYLNSMCTLLWRLAD
jgi:hypothetical protein